MRTIRKGPCPPTILEAHTKWQDECANMLPTIPSTRTRRTRFDDSDKTTSRKYLVREQMGLCAFCLGRIWTVIGDAEELLPGQYRPQPSDPITRIAHVQSLSDAHMSILEWRNLLGACNGGTDAAPHCDRSQGDMSLNVNPALLSFPIEDHILYSSVGKLTYGGPGIQISPDRLFTKDEIQQEFDDILKLNCTRLKDNRAAVIDEARRRLPNNERRWTRRQLENEIRHWSTPGPDGFSIYFCVQVGYLKKKHRQSSA